MIDIAKERLYTLNQARRWFPRRRRGKRPSLPTMYRWSNEGYQDSILETVQVGSTRCTSREACVRFIEQISGIGACPEGPPSAPTHRTASQVDRALAEAGFDRRPNSSRTTGGRAGSDPSRRSALRPPGPAGAAAGRASGGENP